MQRDKFVTLDGLRGLAAIIIMIRHLNITTDLPILQSGYLAVDLFFCLSGFIIAHSYQEKFQHGFSFTDFMKKRLIRLYPMFLAGTILGLAAILMKIWFEQTDFTLLSAISAAGQNLLYLPVLGDHSIILKEQLVKQGDIFPLNPPAWSLFFELIINLFFAFLMVWKKTIPLRLISIITIAGILIWLMSDLLKMTDIDGPGWGEENFILGFPRVAYGFFMGVLIFNIPKNFIKLVPKLKYPMLFLILIIISSVPTMDDFIFTKYSILLFAIPLLVLMGSLTEPTNPRTISLFNYLGWLSYPLYCVHFPIFFIFTCFQPTYGLTPVNIFLCSLISIFLAHVLGKLYDFPVRKHLSEKYTR